MGVDLSLLVGKLYKSGIPVRGLAHPTVFGAATGGLGGPGGNSNTTLRKNSALGRIPGIVEDLPHHTDTKNNTDTSNSIQNVQRFEEFGAVMVTPRNFYRLLQTGQNALVSFLCMY